MGQSRFPNIKLAFKWPFTFRIRWSLIMYVHGNDWTRRGKKIWILMILVFVWNYVRCTLIYLITSGFVHIFFLVLILDIFDACSWTKYVYYIPFYVQGSVFALFWNYHCLYEINHCSNKDYFIIIYLSILQFTKLVRFSIALVLELYSL